MRKHILGVCSVWSEHCFDNSLSLVLTSMCLYELHLITTFTNGTMTKVTRSYKLCVKYDNDSSDKRRFKLQMY